MSEKTSPPSPFPPPLAEGPQAARTRFFVVTAALLAVFLGALDAYVVSTGMPTVITELGGLELYGWVFSAFMLTRAIALPVFGKLADLYGSRPAFLAAMLIFCGASALCGSAATMPQLIFWRAVQGVGAGGIFAVAYTVVAEVSTPETRGRMMSYVSFTWGVASVLGPPLGGFVVAWASWPWVFYVNLPVGVFALLCVLLYFRETRPRRANARIDVAGALTFTAAILGLLFASLLGGNEIPWVSPHMAVLLAASVILTAVFLRIEGRAADPLLPLAFFRNANFTSGNASAFLASFGVFGLMAFIPLFIQGALGRSPAEVGVLLIPLSLGWCTGSLVCGRVVNALGRRRASLLGSVSMVVGSALSLTLSPETGRAWFSLVMALIGAGMGFISISTLLVVQAATPERDLGVATSSHQFARTLGGTLGVGVPGTLVMAHMREAAEAVPGVPADVLSRLAENLQDLFRPEVLSGLSPAARAGLSQAVADGIGVIFVVCVAASVLALLAALFIREARRPPSTP